MAWLNVNVLCTLVCLKQRTGSDRRTAGQHLPSDLGTQDQNAQNPTSRALQLLVTRKKSHAQGTKESRSHQIGPSKHQIFASCVAECELLKTLPLLFIM